MKILRDVGAGIIATIIGIVLAYATDALLQGLGLLREGSLYNSWLLVVFILLYRSIYSALGCYVGAKIAAPGHAMPLVWVLGIIGFVMSAAGAIATWNQNLGPHWYPITLAILAVPAAWLGGKWAGR